MRYIVATFATLSLFLSGFAALPAFAQTSDDYGNGSNLGTYCPKLSSTFQKGARDATTNGQVSELQAFLADYYNLDDGILVGGFFGKLTQKYVVQFQREQGLPTFGIAGSMTRAAITKVCGSSVSQSASPTIAVKSVSGNNLYIKFTDMPEFLFDIVSNGTNYVLVSNLAPSVNAGTADALVQIPNLEYGSYFLRVHRTSDGQVIATSAPFSVSATTSSGNNTQVATEQVKCVFNGATTEQKCWGYAPSPTVGAPTYFNCAGVGTCVVAVSGQQGTPITWGSSCGGSANTTIDNNNEYANFTCSTQNIGNVVLSFTTDKTTYTTGENITFNVTVKNNSTNNVTYQVSNCGATNPFYVYFNNGNYKLSFPQSSCTDVIQKTVSLVPSQSATYGFTGQVLNYSNLLNTNSVALGMDLETSAGKVTATNNVYISAMPIIKVLSPNGGEQWKQDTDNWIVWQPNQTQIVPRIDEYVFDTNGQNVISATYRENTGQDGWAPHIAGKFKVKICQSGTTNCDESDDWFTIGSGSTNSTPSITVFSPNVSVKFGSMYTVSWNAQNIPTNTNLAFSLIASDGKAYRIKDTTTPATSGSFQWTMNGTGCWGTQCAENVMKVGDSFKLRAQIYTPANSCYDGQWSGGACPSGTPTATIVAEDMSDQSFLVVQ